MWRTATRNKNLQGNSRLAAMGTNVRVRYPRAARRRDGMSYRCGGKVEDVTSELGGSIMLEVIRGLDQGHRCRHTR